MFCMVRRSPRSTPVGPYRSCVKNKMRAYWSRATLCNIPIGLPLCKKTMENGRSGDGRMGEFHKAVARMDEWKWMEMVDKAVASAPIPLHIYASSA